MLNKILLLFPLQRQKERRVYTDQDIDDDEIEGKRLFSIEEKLNSPKYNASFVITRDSGEGKH